MTSPTPDIRLSTDEVRKHANSVQETARMLDESLAGATHIRASNGAYGQLISPLFIGPLNLVQDLAIAEVKHAAEVTEHLADLLREMASEVDLTDSEAACRLRGVW